MLNSYRPNSVTTVWQLIRDPIHCRGYILHWMVVWENNGSVSQSKVLSISFSDHSAIVGLTALNNSLTHCRVVSFQKPEKSRLSNDASWHPATFRHWTRWLLRLWACRPVQSGPPLCSGPTRSTDQQKSNQPSVTPWRTDGIITAKKELRQAERRWRSSGLTVYKELYPIK